MSSLKMTFSLTSLILIFALTFSAAFVHEAHANADFEGKTIADQVFIANIAIASLTLPTAKNADSYTLSSPPSGLTFNAATRVLSGTPDTAAARTTFTYTAVDNDANDATIVFTIEVKANQAPKFATGAKIENQVFKIGKDVEGQVTFPTATDPDAGDRLTYSISSGTLPDGVQFDPFGRRFIGQATTANATPETLTYTVTDLGTNTVDLTFTVVVEVDEKPTFGTGTTRESIDPVNVKVGEDVEVFLPTATDANTGETAKLVYTLAPTTLPAGLEYIASARLLRGTPTAVKAVTEYTYTVTDPDGNTDALKFNITVRADPVFADSASIRDYTFVIGTEVDAGPFPTATDADDDIDGYSLSPQPPDGIVWVPVLRKLVGNPTTAQSETDYTYTVTDKAGGTDTLEFKITVSATAPVTAPAKPAAPTAMINADNDLVIDVSWTAPANNGSAITGYTVKKYGSDGTLVKTFPEAGADAITATMLAVGPVPEADRGMSFTFTVMATNAEGDSDESDMSAAVMIPATPAVSMLPQPTDVATEAKTDGSIDVTWAWTGTTEQMEALDGFTVSWTYNPTMTADAAADARMYNIPADMLSVGRDTTVTVMAKEKSGSGFGPSPAAPAPAPAIPTSPPVNSPPVFTASASIADISARVGIAITAVTLPEAADGDGDVLTYSVDPMLDGTNGLTFDAATRMISGTPSAAMAATTYTYKASDGEDEVMLTFDITIAANNAPAFAAGTTIADVSAREGIALTAVTLPTATDADAADSVTHSLTPALPAGLTRTGMTISGTPTAAAIGAGVTYTWAATDGIDVTSLTFTIAVAADTAPTFGGATIGTISATNGTAITPQILPMATDADGDAITSYTLTPSVSAIGLSFNATSRLLSGTPNADSTPTIYTYTANTVGKDASLTFIIEVNPAPTPPTTPNNAPTFGGATISSVSATVNVAIAPQVLPAATDADGDTITYSLTPMPLPTGLTYNTVTRLLSGTPTAMMAAAAYTYTASDGKDSATLSFVIEVKDAPPVVTPPANRAPTFAGQTIAPINGTVGMAITPVTLPEATDLDGDAIAYSILQTLPTGLSFNSVTRYLSGTPSVAAAAANYTYVASDGKTGGTVALNFTLAVQAAAPAKPATIQIPTATSSSAPIALADRFVNPVVPARGFVVLVRDVDGSGTYNPLPNTWKRSMDTALPDLAWFFGGTGGTNGGTIALHGPAGAHAKDLVISEIMWGTNSSLAVPERSQWIEFYNATLSDIPLAGYTITFHRSQVPAAAWAGAVDVVSNAGQIYFGHSEFPGQSGRTDPVDTQGRYAATQNLISMFRDIDHVWVEHHNVANRGERDKRIGGWLEAMYPTANIQPGRVATPGAEQIRRVTIANTTMSQDVIINEIGNSANDDYDWIELHNTTSAAIKLRKWDFTMIVKEGDVGKEKRIFQFPDNDTVWVPANGYLVIARSHPRNDGNDLAAGIDVTKAAIDQLKRGLGEKNLASHPTAYYYVNSGLVLPNDTTPRLFVLRNANDKHGQPSHVVDATGMLSIEVRGDLPAGFTGHVPHTRQLWDTATWPFQGSGGRHGNVIDGGDEDFRAGKVYQRNGKNSGIGEKHLAVRGYTGVGYDRHAAVNGENGGTPGYSKDAVKGDKSNWGNQVSISEIMLVTEEGEGAGRVPRATRLPQWFEIYNASLTEAVSINNWYLEIQNDDTPDFLTNLHGTLRLPNVIIQPNQTVLVVSSSGLHSPNFPEQRTINVFTNSTYRQILGLTRRGEPMLNPAGFYIELRDHKGNSVDEIGNLGVSRRTGAGRRDNFGEQWEMPSLHSEDGHRTSLVRIYDNGVPRNGLNKAKVLGLGLNEADRPIDADTSWIRASDTNFRNVPSLTYYGNHRDFGTPGYRGGGPLPVSLSKFRPERLESGDVVIRWVTQSELNNAGFNILRSDTRDGQYTKVNTQLIAGQGTTSEKTSYEWKDTTAKPNVVYYYQIQDVSIDGKIQTLRVSRLKGNVTAAGKATTTWGELKALQ